MNTNRSSRAQLDSKPFQKGTAARRQSRAFRTRLTLALITVLLLTGCGTQAEPTPTRTPRPSATPTMLPTVALVLPAVESGGEAPRATDTPQPPQPEPTVGEPTTGPLAPDDAMSPLVPPTETPVLVPSATPTPSFDAREPIPALAANLACGQGCNAGNPDGVGLALFNLDTGQLNTYVNNLDPLPDQEYEGWLVEGNRAESTGRFNVRPDGTAVEFIILAGLKDEPWSSFVLTIEPQVDLDAGPAVEHSIGGPLRRTVMGEALYSRFDMPCQQCHGSAAEGGTGPALAGIPISFEDFLTVVRNHPNAEFPEEIAANRDLRHIYAWLRALAP